MFESQADFARRCGVSRKTVSKWKTAERLVLQGDQVDVEATLALMERHRKGGAPAVTPTVTTAVTLAHSGNKQGNNSNGGEAAKQHGESLANAVSLQPGESIDEAAERLIGEIDMNMSFDEARRLKEVYLVLLNRLEFEQRSGGLVDLQTASSILFEEFRAARDSWLNWPARIGPMLAADLGIEADRVTSLLTGYVHKHVSSLGEPQAEFGERP